MGLSVRVGAAREEHLARIHSETAPGQHGHKYRVGTLKDELRCYPGRLPAGTHLYMTETRDKVHFLRPEGRWGKQSTVDFMRTLEHQWGGDAGSFVKGNLRVLAPGFFDPEAKNALAPTSTYRLWRKFGPSSDYDNRTAPSEAERLRASDFSRPLSGDIRTMHSSLLLDLRMTGRPAEPDFNVNKAMLEFYLLETMLIAEQSRYDTSRADHQQWRQQVNIRQLQAELVKEVAPKLCGFLVQRLYPALEGLSKVAAKDPLWLQRLVPERLRPAGKVSNWLEHALGQGMTVGEFGHITDRLVDNPPPEDVYIHEVKGWEGILKAIANYDKLLPKVWVDHVFSLAHNTGLVFQRLRSWRGQGTEFAAHLAKAVLKEADTQKGDDPVSFYATARRHVLHELEDINSALTDNNLSVHGLSQWCGLRLAPNIAKALVRGSGIGLWPNGATVGQDLGMTHLTEVAHFTGQGPPRWLTGESVDEK